MIYLWRVMVVESLAIAFSMSPEFVKDIISDALAFSD